MDNYYFTFGTGKDFPYQGGWVVVKANSYGEARNKFKEKFGTRDGYLPFAFQYSEEEFELSGMDKRGNFGEFCHEVIGEEKEEK